MVRAADPTRLPGLDLLRTHAIGWVMVCHASGFGLLPADYCGSMGADLFFVLSGFLIGGLSHKVAYRAVIRLPLHASPQVQAPLLAICAALVLGAALNRIVERPFLRLRDGFRSEAPPAPLGVPVAAE